MRRFAAVAFVVALAVCTPASAATWTEPDITTLPGSLVEGDGAYVELPWDVIWELGSIIPGAALDPRAVERLANGNTLITSRDSRGVREVTPDGQIVWSYTDADDPDLWPFHGTRLANGNTLIVDRWQETVIEVTPGGDVVWRYGVPDEPTDAGAPDFQMNDDTEQPDPGELIDPFTAFRLPNGNTLIADNQACRVIEVRTSDYRPGEPNDGYTAQSIVWQYGVTLELAADHAYAEGYLDWPKWAVRLDNGNTLIADETGNRVLEVTPGGDVVWSYGQPGVAGDAVGQLNEPVTAERMTDGSTLITDGGNNRVLRVSADGEILWNIGTPDEYGLDSAGLDGPRRATITPTGTLLIADSSHGRLLEMGYAPSGLVTSGQIDCGLPGARKRFVSLDVAVDAPEGTSYQALYSIDGGPWTVLDGTSLPTGTYGIVLRYRVAFATAQADRSPRLIGVAVGYESAPVQPAGGSGTGSGTGSGSGSGGSAGGSGTRTPRLALPQSGTMSSGEGYTSGESIEVADTLVGPVSSQRGWALASITTDTSVAGALANSGAPAPSTEGVIFLSVLYAAGALSVPLGKIMRFPSHL